MSDVDPFIRKDVVEEYRMPLVEHLRELRHRLIVSAVAALAGVFGCLAYAEPIWVFLAEPMNAALAQHGGTMAQLDPLEGFVNQLKVAGLAGTMLASPVISYQLWKFIAPGLYKEEKRAVLPVAMASTFLFLTGVVFGYTVIFKYAFPYFLEVSPEDVEAVISINAYLSVATKLLVAFGVAFQLPVVVYFLARLGLINARDMIDGFRYSLVAIFVVAAILTPPDVLSQILMAIPLVFLYGIGIIVAWIFTTKEATAPDEADAPPVS